MDNGVDITKAECGGCFPLVPCLAHGLSLGMRKFMGGVGYRDAGTAVNGHFSWSRALHRNLRELQESLKLPCHQLK